MNYIRNGETIDGILKVRVYPNGSMHELGSELLNNGHLVIHNPKPNKIYTACMYVDFRKMNLIKEEHEKEYIGTIEKY